MKLSQVGNGFQPTKQCAAELCVMRMMIRQIRGEAMREIRSMFEEKGLSEDEKFDQEKKLNKHSPPRKSIIMTST